MKRVIRADDLIGYIALLEKVYQHDDGAKAMAKSVRTYVSALADDPDYQSAFGSEGPTLRQIEEGLVA